MAATSSTGPRSAGWRPGMPAKRETERRPLFTKCRCLPDAPRRQQSLRIEQPLEPCQQQALLLRQARREGRALGDADAVLGADAAAEAVDHGVDVLGQSGDQ